MNRGSKGRVKYILLLIIFLVLITLIIDGAAKLMFPLKYSEYVIKYSDEQGIDPHLVFAIIKAESSFNPRATSYRGAKGLMQITDRTGSWGADSLNIEDFTVEHLYDPEINIRIGCWYIDKLMKEFNNNVDLVIAAYNGGSGNVSEWLKNKNYSDSGTSLEKIPFKETDKYLKRVKNYYSVYKSLYEKAF